MELELLLNTGSGQQLQGKRIFSPCNDFVYGLARSQALA
jgi:hypothetical protein